MTSAGRKIAVHTVENYLDALTESFIFYRAGRYDIKGKQYLKTGDKYYAADIGLRYCVLGSKKADNGHILENIVYLEHRRRGYEVYIVFRKILVHSHQLFSIYPSFHIFICFCSGISENKNLMGDNVFPNIFYISAYDLRYLWPGQIHILTLLLSV